MVAIKIQPLRYSWPSMNMSATKARRWSSESPTQIQNWKVFYNRAESQLWTYRRRFVTKNLTNIGHQKDTTSSATKSKSHCADYSSSKPIVYLMRRKNWDGFVSVGTET